MFSLVAKPFLEIYNQKDDIHLEPTGTTKLGDDVGIALT